jgi:hypothetical protein
LPPRLERSILAPPNKHLSKESSVGKNSNIGKLARSPYPKAAREILVEFTGTMEVQPNQAIAGRAYRELNQAMINSGLKKRPFIGVRFSMANNLVITVRLLETNADYEAYLPIIVNTLAFIETEKATISDPWTKYLLHGISTSMDLEEIREDVENWYTLIQTRSNT